jgi:hypothetical protein
VDDVIGKRGHDRLHVVRGLGGEVPGHDLVHLGGLHGLYPLKP